MPVAKQTGTCSRLVYKSTVIDTSQVGWWNSLNLSYVIFDLAALELLFTLWLFSLFKLFSIDAEMLRCGGCVEDVRDECGLVFLDMCEEEEEEEGGGGGRRRRRRRRREE